MVGRVSLGVAVIGGDASQRSPPSSLSDVPETKFTRPLSTTNSVQHTSPTTQMTDDSVSGDASQRVPMGGRVSLGVAVIGGDASQRSPPSSLSHAPGTTFASPCSTTNSVQHTSPTSQMTDDSIVKQAYNASCSNANSIPQGITSTCPAVSAPDSSRSSSPKDASQRSPGSVPTDLKVGGCSDALKSWLSGANGKGSQRNGVALAERLRAAAPESYED